MIGVDGGADKDAFVKSIGAKEFVDFTQTTDVVAAVKSITGGGAHAVVVTAGNAKAYAQAAEMLRVGGTLSCCGIPPGKSFIEAPVSSIVIKGLRICGNLVGSLKECMEAVDFVREGKVKPHVSVRPFRSLPDVYRELEEGEISGRIVLKVADE